MVVGTQGKAPRRGMVGPFQPQKSCHPLCSESSKIKGAEVFVDHRAKLKNVRSTAGFRMFLFNPVELVSCPENYVPFDSQSDVTSVKPP